MHAAVIPAPGTGPAAGDFPEPSPAPGLEPLTLVAAGIHQVVRSLAAGTHYGSEGVYPLVPGIDAVARTEEGRLVYTAGARAPWGTFAERLAMPMTIDLPPDADPLAIAAGVNPGMSGWMPLVAHRDRPGGLGTVVVVGATACQAGWPSSRRSRWAPTG